jgi:hypothetical protein
MAKSKRKDTPAAQSARFREAAKKAEVSDKAFERAFKKIVPPQKPAAKKA